MSDQLGEALAYWREGILEGQSDNLTKEMLEDARHFDAIVAAARNWHALTEGDKLWQRRFCIQHLAEVTRDDTECDYADEWADEEMRCNVHSVLLVDALAVTADEETTP